MLLPLDLNGSTVVVFGGIFLMTWILFKRLNDDDQRDRPRPPCLPTLPFIGSLFYLPKDIKVLASFYTKTAERLGPVFALYGGSRYTVVLNGKEAIAEAYLKHSYDFADRDQLYSEKYYSNPNLKGIAMRRYDEDFKKIHKLSLSILKELGYGARNVMEKRIQTELDAFVKQAKCFQGKSFNPKMLAVQCIANVILGITFGTRYELEDPKMSKFLKSLSESMSHASIILGVLPILRFTQRCRQDFRKLSELREYFAKTLGEEIEKSLNSKEESFVKKFVEIEGHNYDRENLIFIARDFAVGGSDTSSLTILWGLIMLANHPEIQGRVQKEIDSVVPKERRPSLEDAPNLPYTEATILELMRWKAIVHLPLMHSTIRDTDVYGLFIPAGTRVVTNLHSVNMNPMVFPEPELCKPERFLDENGKLFGAERIIPFSLGKRSCIGEQLARQEIFLFFSGIVQQFKILPPEGQDMITVDEIVDLVVVPSPFEVRLIPRE